MDLGDGMKAFFCGAVLWMQGPQLTPQPIETEQGVLLYNGDIFDETWPHDVSDTQVIMEKLNNNVRIYLTFISAIIFYLFLVYIKFKSQEKSSEEYILQQLKKLKGPFSIIFYEKLNKKLYFMRDRIGRSTLLFHKGDNSIIISNVLGRNYDCVEVPAAHIQILNLSTNIIELCPWNDDFSLTKPLPIEEWIKQLRIQQGLPDDEFNFEYAQEDFTEEVNFKLVI